MLNKVLVVAIIFAASFSQAESKMKRPAGTMNRAQPVSNSSTLSMSAAPVAQGEWYTGHVSVATILSNEMTLKNVDVSSNGKVIGAGEFGTTQTMGLMAQYQDEWKGPWNWNMGVTYLRERDLDSFRGTLSGRTQRTKLQNNPSFAAFVGQVGASYRWNKNLYSPLALNYTLVNNTSSGSLNTLTMNPQLGHQFGIGYQVERNWSAELMFQKVAYSMEAKLGATKLGGDVYTEGLNLQGRYLF